MLDISLVVPAYNEAARIEPTLRACLSYLRSRSLRFELIVVDDGSTDGTAEVVFPLTRECPHLRCIRLPSNCGKGFAVRTGVLNSSGCLVLFLDADGATPIEEIERLEPPILAGAAMAIGSRAAGGTDVRVRARLHRRLMGRTFHQLVQLLTVRGFNDTQCGFKLIRGAVAHDLFSRMRMRGFSFDVELLIIAGQLGYHVAEVPVNWTHRVGSRIDLVRDSLEMVRDLFLIRSYAARGEYGRAGLPIVPASRPVPATPDVRGIAAK